YFEKAKDLRPSLYDEKVIGLGYTPMFLIISDEALEIEKFKRARENKIEFAYDYGNLNASYVNEKINFLDDYFQEIINPDFEKIGSPFQQTSSLKPYVLTVILEKIIIDLEDEVIVQIYLWIIESGCSKNMTGNRTLLTNFVEKFLGTIRFGNNDFVVIAGYGDVVIGSMTIKKVYYVEGLGHNLFSVGQFCDKGLEVAFRKCYLLNDYENVGKLKVKGDIVVFIGYSKESAAFRIYNKRTCKIHESVNVNFDEISEMTSKQFSLEPGLSNLNETEKSSNLSVLQVSETSKKDLEDLFQNF
nr:integrase, catalytic region, zinc finger, CCHC-type, peptidase aspartic, catalytic [Tanacetum cinerariifolium]